MNTLPDVHITRRDEHGPPAWTLTLQGGRDLQELADAIEARLLHYASHVERSKRGQTLTLDFTADREPLGKYELGKINREALLHFAGA